ncbi:hypothetical protein L0337_08145 [candidate division KSB1 bacterium]|nr:hypothetical protein [candidate division KSB1 bacterium]
MRKFYKTISLLLAFSLLQFFVPVLNVAMDLSCCEEQAISGGNMACCGAEFPSRMVCCYGDPTHAFDESAPTQCTLAKISHFHIDLAAVSQGLVASLRFALPIVTGNDFYSLNPLLTSNQRYKLLATFLI